jgi:hypothetical protein
MAGTLVGCVLTDTDVRWFLSFDVFYLLENKALPLCDGGDRVALPASRDVIVFFWLQENLPGKTVRRVMVSFGRGIGPLNATGDAADRNSSGST